MEAAKFEFDVLREALAIKEELAELAPHDRDLLGDVPLRLERLVKRLERRYKESAKVLERVSRLEAALTPTLYNMSLDHPIFGGKTPTQVMTCQWGKPKVLPGGSSTQAGKTTKAIQAARATEAGKAKQANTSTDTEEEA